MTDQLTKTAPKIIYLQISDAEAQDDCTYVRMEVALLIQIE